MADVEQTNRIPKYTITLNGSEWSTAKYGIVEYLRVHPFWRAVTAIAGLLFVVPWIMTFAGIKIASGGSLAFVTVFWAPTLLWLATVSGPAFQLVFPEAKASEERQSAEKKFEETKTPEDALNRDFSVLNEYYTINQSQARSSFRWAIFSMFLGLGTIVAGIWFFYLRTAQPDKFMASLSTAAGVVINLISALYLYLYSKTQDRSLLYYEQLARLKRIALAMSLVKEYANPEQQAVARDLVVHQLLEVEGVASGDLTAKKSPR